MGRKITDGLAVDVVVPAGESVEKGEIYRIDGWTGIAMDNAEAGESVALEVSLALWRCKTPAGVGATRGVLLYWTAGAGFKEGATDLSEAVAGGPVAKVEGVRNASGYATVRVLNNA